VFGLKSLLKPVQCDIEASHLTEDLIKKLVSLVKKHPGSASLKLRVLDTSEKLFVEMPSLKLRVNPNNTFINELKELTGMEWKIN